MKKLKVDIYSPTSDIVASDVLAKAGVSTNAAEVIRDANGKVIKVNVNLPDAAADAAKIAISNNPGVAFVSTDPIGSIIYQWDINKSNDLGESWEERQDALDRTIVGDGIKYVSTSPGYFGNVTFREFGSLMFKGDANADFYIRLKFDIKTDPDGAILAGILSKSSEKLALLQVITRGANSPIDDVIRTANDSNVLQSDVVTIPDTLQEIKLEIQSNFDDRISYQYNDVEYPVSPALPGFLSTGSSTEMDFRFILVGQNTEVTLKEVLIQEVTV